MTRSARYLGIAGLAGLSACAAPVPAPLLAPTQFHPVAESSAPLDSQPLDLAVLNRVSWGAETADAQTLSRTGLSDYLRQQLHPRTEDGLPADAAGQISAMEISQKNVVQINDEIRGLREAAQKLKGTPDYEAAQKLYQQKMGDLARQAATRSLLRDLYSQNQLKEELTWFWMNHFNVYQNKNDIRYLVADYEETAIRPHVLGKFRDLLTATVIHPAMLEYLDNAQNANGHINENYARELMELHTMGVGSGYTQQDVQQLARILTGLGTNLSGKPIGMKKGMERLYRGEGLLLFNPARHDFGEKTLLGVTIKGSGLGEVGQAIALLAAQPATARHVSIQLAQYFCCDVPPASLVNKMVATWQATDGDIRQVLATLLTAPEFKASLGHKFKDPTHYAISALRASYGQQVILNAQPLLNWLNRMGEPLYGHETPDGYPMTESAWSGPGEMETRFEIARQIGLGHSGLYKLPSDPPNMKETAAPPTIQNTHYYGAISVNLSANTQAVLGQAQNPTERNLLFLSSPEFMYR